MNDIIFKKHQNTLQADELSRAIYNCSMLARKLIAFATTKIQEKTIDQTPFWSEVPMNTYVPCAEFKISELLKALNLSKCGENYELVKKATNELRHCSIEIKEDDDEFRIWNWFQYIQFSKKKDKIELHFSDEIGWALMNLEENYCSLDLHTVGEFKSFYAFRFYEIALSWKGMKGRNGNAPELWWFQMTPEDIRRIFKISDEAYKGRLDNFIRKVILIPIDELNSICDEFKIEVFRVKRGRNLVGFRFECKEQKTEKKKILKSDEKQIRQEKRKINEENEEINFYKNKFPDEFAEALKEAKSQNQFAGFPRLEAIDEFEAVKIMKDKGF